MPINPYIGLTVPTSLVRALIVQALIGLIAPPLIAFFVNRKLRVGWRWIWYGAIAFLIIDIVSLVLGVLVAVFMGWLFGPTLPIIRPIRGAVVAGIIEEGGRYLGYLLFFREGERNWDRAVLYGLGSGGFEAMADETLRNLLLVAAFLYAPRLRPGEFGLNRKKLVQLFRLLNTFVTPPWEPLVGSVARVQMVGFHMCFATIVLQVFRRGSIQWLLYAMVFHIVIDATIGVTSVYAVWAGDLLSLSWAIVAVILMLRLREAAPPSAAQLLPEPVNAFDAIPSEES